MDTGYLVRRSGQAVVTVVAVVTITFAMIRLLPGGPGVIDCIRAGAAGGGMSRRCQDILDQSGSASIPVGELAVLGLFVLGLVVLSAYLWTDY